MTNARRGTTRLTPINSTEKVGAALAGTLTSLNESMAVWTLGRGPEQVDSSGRLSP